MITNTIPQECRDFTSPALKTLVRAMKLIAIIITLGCLQVSAHGFSQGISIKVKNVPFSQVLTEIEKQTGVSFIYGKGLIEKAGKVSFEVKNQPLSTVLELLFKNQPLDYKISDNYIVISPKPAATSQLSTPAQILQKADPIDVRGRISNENGEPVDGATVAVKGTNIITATNSNGEFQLTGIDENATLVITGVSIETSEIRVEGKRELAITSVTKVTSLNELIINKGYYIEKQGLSVGNVGKVTAKDIEKQPINNPLYALQGRVAGVIVTQQSGVPGSNVSIQIRGRNSIAMGNDPLFIIDGVPYPSQMLPNTGTILTQGGNPLNFISATDIESISILKDADATAIYGSRGANGVVLITTKKGKSGDTRIDLNFYSGIGNVTRKARLLNAQQYLQARNEAFKNDARTPVSFDYDVNGVWDKNASSDWPEQLIGGTAHYTEARTSASGGNENIQYLIAGAYHKETTVFPSDFNNQKVSVHFNINSISLNRKFKMMLSGNYMNDNCDLPYIDLTQRIFLAPNAPGGYKVDGSLNWDVNNDYGNPFASLLARYKTVANTLVGNSVLSYLIVPNLEIKTCLGYNTVMFKDKQMFPTTYYIPSYNVKNGSANFSNSLTDFWIVEPQANYEKNFKKNKLAISIGTSIQSNTTEGEVLNATGYTNNDLLGSLAGAATITKGSITTSEYKYSSIFGRINYNWDEKYLFNLTGRRDGSSRFGPDKQFANFGAIGAGWVFSRSELFQKDLQFISYGKIRASYGTSGNDQIPDYRFQELYGFVAGAPYQGVPGLQPVNLSNPNYAWELNKKLEFGLEIGFFKDRIFISTSFFRNRSSNQLVGYLVPDITGFNTVLANLPAVVENKGFEWQINSLNIDKNKFRWTTSANLTITRNKLLSYPDFEQSPYATSLVLGKPLEIRKVYHVQGVDPASGVYQFMTKAGTLTSTPSSLTDQIDIIDRTPKYYAGIENSLKYSNIQLEFLIQVVNQTGANYLFANAYPPGAGFGYFNPPVEYLNHWQKAGDNAKFQQFTQRTSTPAYRAYRLARNSNYAYSDASFVRLKNVSLSYQLPASVLKKLRLSNLKLYINAQNLLTFTDYIGLDPENQSVNYLPPMRVMVAGIQVTL
jgi:TonB-linked SusC/RagA family outer membrane protein